MIKSKLYSRIEAIEEEVTKRASKETIDIEDSFEEFAKNNIWITDKEGNRIRLSLNSVQSRIEDEIMALQSRNKPVRLIILKARQMGVSTYFQARMLYRSIKKQNYNALVIAHKDDSTRAIFSKSKYMYDNLPKKPPKKASNQRALMLDYPYNSKILIATAGGGSVGRSDTFADAHVSELAFYPDAAEQILNGIMQAVPNKPETIVMLESTANGYNYFQKVWQQAERGENGFTPLFFAWHSFPEYTLPTDSTLKELRLDDYETNLVLRFNLSANQINWYRHTKKTNCNNSPTMMMQEYPSTPEESFISTGTPVYDTDKIMKRINYLEELYSKQEPNRYNISYDLDDASNLICGKPRFTKCNTGSLYIYKLPEAGRPYSIGGDVSEGANDYSTICVLDNATGNQVATFSSRIPQTEYARMVICIASLYSKSKVIIESNIATHIIAELQRFGIEQYQEEEDGKAIKEKLERYGYRTSSTSKRMRILNYTIDAVNENIDKINDLTLLYEMLHYTYSGVRGRPDHATDKHDDNIFAFGLSLVLHYSNQLTHVPVNPYTNRPTEIVFGQSYYYEDLVAIVGYTEAANLIADGKVIVRKERRVEFG